MEQVFARFVADFATTKFAGFVMNLAGSLSFVDSVRDPTTRSASPLRKLTRIFVGGSVTRLLGSYSGFAWSLASQSGFAGSASAFVYSVDPVMSLAMKLWFVNFAGFVTMINSVNSVYFVAVPVMMHCSVIDLKD